MGGIISAIFNFIGNFSIITIALVLILIFGWNFWTGLFILAIYLALDFKIVILVMFAARSFHPNPGADQISTWCRYGEVFADIHR